VEIMKFAALIAVLLAGSQSRPSPLDGVGVDQKPGAEIPLDLVFRDEQGGPVTLRQAAGKTPFLLAPVYYRCPQLCQQVLLGLLTGLKAMGPDAGTGFHVVTVSFDPAEDAALAVEKKKSTLRTYGRSGGESGWRFLTGDRESIERLCRSIGFRYSADPETGRFAHAAAVVVATADGRVSRTLFGIDYRARDLRLALAEAAEGKTGSIVEPLLLYCYRYDPETGRYGVAVLRLVRTGGLATAATVAVWIAVLSRRHRRRKLLRIT
jgi:protein SCO1/2